MTVGIRGVNAQLDHELFADLLARRWREGRPYFTLREPLDGMGLQAWWQRRPGHAGLDLHWSRWSPRSGANRRWPLTNYSRP